jgi:hypothetical protein
VWLTALVFCDSGLKEAKITGLASSDAIRHTFQWVQPKTSLDAFVQLAINPGDENYRHSTAQGYPGAARELLQYLTDLHAHANCKTTEQFLIGYEPMQPELPDVQIAKWEKFLSTAFELMMLAPEDKNRTGDFATRLTTLIREAADFTSPLLHAWGV